MVVGDLFHWSPADRRESIRGEGLKPYSRPAVSSGDQSFPYLCLSPNPQWGWQLSGDMDWVSEIEAWDLWQVKLIDGDEVHYLPQWGPWLKEIRVHNAIPADRVWHVATRSCACAESSQ